MNLNIMNNNLFLYHLVLAKGKQLLQDVLLKREKQLIITLKHFPLFLQTV